jgi:DNA-binding winged helix-turn-helix (wHTH) protein
MDASADWKPRQLYGFGPFRLDPDKELLLRQDETVLIAPKAFQVLLVLIRNNKQVVTKDELMKTIWPDTFVEEANLSRNIFLLRKALGETPQDHQYIVTVPGRGYRFAAGIGPGTRYCCREPFQCRSSGGRDQALGMDRRRGSSSRRDGRRCLEAVGPSRTGAHYQRHYRARRLHEFDWQSGL